MIGIIMYMLWYVRCLYMILYHICTILYIWVGGEGHVIRLSRNTLKLVFINITIITTISSK